MGLSGDTGKYLEEVEPEVPGDYFPSQDKFKMSDGLRAEASVLSFDDFYEEVLKRTEDKNYMETFKNVGYESEKVKQISVLIDDDGSKTGEKICKVLDDSRLGYEKRKGGNKTHSNDYESALEKVLQKCEVPLPIKSTQVTEFIHRKETLPLKINDFYPGKFSQAKDEAVQDIETWNEAFEMVSEALKSRKPRAYWYPENKGRPNEDWYGLGDQNNSSEKGERKMKDRRTLRKDMIFEVDGQEITGELKPSSERYKGPLEGRHAQLVSYHALDKVKGNEEPFLFLTPCPPLVREVMMLEEFSENTGRDVYSVAVSSQDRLRKSLDNEIENIDSSIEEYKRQKKDTKSLFVERGHLSKIYDELFQ